MSPVYKAVIEVTPHFSGYDHTIVSDDYAISPHTIETILNAPVIRKWMFRKSIGYFLVGYTVGEDGTQGIDYLFSLVELPLRGIQ